MWGWEQCTVDVSTYHTPNIATVSTTHSSANNVANIVTDNVTNNVPNIVTDNVTNSVSYCCKPSNLTTQCFSYNVPDQSTNGAYSGWIMFGCCWVV